MGIYDQLSLDQAYQAAYLWLDHAGDPPVEISEPAHGSVELVTERMFVRVRSSDSPVEQSSVLALLRAAETGKKLVIFSPSGFSPGALSIAETQGIALYTLDGTGRAIAETTHARSLAPVNEPDPPFAPTATDDEHDFWNVAPQRAVEPEEPEDDGDPELQAGIADWLDCPKCGSTHHRNAKFCRECGTNLQNGSTPGSQGMPGASAPGASAKPEHASKMPGTMLRCRTCGGHDIELVN